MTQQPLSAAAMRGAIDLSSLGKRAPEQAAGSGNRGMITATDQTFESIVNGTTSVPGVMVVWSAQLPESLQHAEALVSLSQTYEGRFQVIGVELDANPGIVQALTPVLQQTFGQIDALPIVMGLLRGQPMPFYLGVQDVSALRPLIDKFLEAAATQGVTGRADLGPGEAATEDSDAEEELSPTQQAAYDAIERGDLPAATAVYETALKANPADEEARLGLAQVALLQRTADLDVAEVRRAAADAPTDVAAQSAAADLELVGGHVEDAFARLVDLVRATAGDERAAARDHLLSLFEVIGAHDPRVSTARRALTNALF
ncbi:MAG: tetratricopeptide repeat protein [Ornithinimicrobium sp.]